MPIQRTEALLIEQCSFNLIWHALGRSRNLVTMGFRPNFSSCKFKIVPKPPPGYDAYCCVKT